MKANKDDKWLRRSVELPPKDEKHRFCLPDLVFLTEDKKGFMIGIGILIGRKK